MMIGPGLKIRRGTSATVLLAVSGLSAIAALMASFSPGEMSRYLGIGYLAYLALFLLFSIIFSLILSTFLVSRKMIAAAVAVSVYPIVLIGVFGIFVLHRTEFNPTFAMESVWNGIRAARSRPTCLIGVFCDGAIILNKEYWGGGLEGGECLDLLIFIKDDKGSQAKDFAGDYAIRESNFEPEATVLNVKRLSQNMFSAVVCHI